MSRATEVSELAGIAQATSARDVMRRYARLARMMNRVALRSARRSASRRALAECRDEAMQAARIVRDAIGSLDRADIRMHKAR